MFTKFFQKGNKQQSPPAQKNVKQRSWTSKDLDPRVTVHYGIPSSASIIAFDPVQSLLAVGTSDGRIKVIGGDSIEGLLVSPKQSTLKNLEFLQNQGLLVSVTNKNEIQMWDLEDRRIASTLTWESNITAFSVIFGTSYMYIGDEYGMVSVLKYEAEGGQLLQMPYYVPANVIAEAAGISSSNHYAVVGVLPQPYSQGKRLLIAYENGLIVLWDVSEDRVVMVKGNKDLQLKAEAVVNPSKGASHELSETVSSHEQAEKEISSLCWASNDGSVLAVGYVDGDIMFWQLPTAGSTKDQKAENLSNDVVKLQLSSGKTRLPIITLHWSVDRSHKDCGCQLFVYGGDEIGSEEVLTILYLDWSSGKGLKYIGREDLKLNGSFADMVLLPSAGMMNNYGTMLFVLTNPGELHVYDEACLSFALSKEKRTSSSSLQYPTIIPTIEPHMTVGKLRMVHRDGDLSMDLSKTVSATKPHASQTPSTKLMGSTNWPLTGAVPCQFYDAEDYLVERLYMAGYQDGSVRIWDATYPTLSLIYVLGSDLAGEGISGTNAPVSALEFCSSTLSLATGNACGMVCLYKLIRSSNEASLDFVTETRKEVHILPQGDGPECKAVFALLSSPVCNLKFANFGARLAVGFECGQVAVLDISTSSLLFVTDSLSNPSSPVMYLAVKSFSVTESLTKSTEDSDINTSNDSVRELVFFMTKDAYIVVCDSITGYILASQSIHPKESNAISMYILEGGNLFSEASSEIQSENSPQNNKTKNEPDQTYANYGSDPVKAELEISSETAYLGRLLIDLFVILCCQDAFLLYPLKSVIQGHSNSIQEVNLLKPCCWTTTFKKNEKECGLLVLYQTGDIEIRSLPNLVVVAETSLMSILRWNFKTDMEKTMCSSESGQIVLINEQELAFISLLAYENDFRIPESLPHLHDKVLAAAADAAINLSPSPKKEEGTALGILGAIVKGFKADKTQHNVNMPEVSIHTCAHLESIFSCPPFLKPSITDDLKVVDLDIDDIDIDEPLVISSSSQTSSNDRKEKGKERERLFEGATTDAKPKARTVEEIKSKYKKTGDAYSVAAEARNKLAERQEKLEKLRERTEELQSGAENFADLASELAKRMEKRKWWQL